MGTVSGHWRATGGVEAMGDGRGRLGVGNFEITNVFSQVCPVR